MFLFVLAKPRNTCICNTSECALPKLIGKTKSFKYITVVYIAVYFIHYSIPCTLVACKLLDFILILTSGEHCEPV